MIVSQDRRRVTKCIINISLYEYCYVDYGCVVPGTINSAVQGKGLHLGLCNGENGNVACILEWGIYYLYWRFTSTHGVDLPCTSTIGCSEFSFF
jgi:hypothetical protein